MKSMLAALLILCCAAVSAQIPRYSVTMSPSDYQLIYSRDMFSDSLLPAAMEFQDSVWAGAGVRFKGHSTRYYPKKAFRVRVATSQLFQGMRDLNFNAMYTDRSFLRERLAWSLFADLGQMAPVSEHALLSINGRPQGLYLFIDKVDRYFLQRRGRILAPMYEADDTYNAADLTEQPDSMLKLYYAKEIGSKTDYSDLAAMIHALNASPDSSFADTVHAYFDMRSLLNWFTGNTLTMMGDSYSKNYFLYRDTSRAAQQWVVIPWDYDLSFGRTGDLAIPYPGSLLNDRFAYTFPPLSGASSVLKDRFMATPALREEFRGHADTALRTLFTEELLHPRIDSLAALVWSEAEADPGRWGTTQDIRDHIDALKYYVTARRNYLLATFVNAPSGSYDRATLPVAQTGVPYHFVTFDGRLIATLRFSTIAGLDSIRVVAHPDSAPPSLGTPGDGRHIRRWLEIRPYPSTASFTASLQWMYEDVSSTSTEVGSGVQDERILRSFVFDGGSRRALPSVLNPYANVVTIDSVTEQECGTGRHFGLALSETYAQQWFRAPLNVWQRWYDVRFADASLGWVLGEHGSILRTTDAGATWTERSIGFNLAFSKLAIVSPETLLAAGRAGALYRSADAGDAWTRIDLGVATDFHDIAFAGDEIGFIAADGAILRTSDGGNTWAAIAADSAVAFRSIAPFGADTIVAGTSAGLSIYRTTDGGASWSSAGAELTGGIHAAVVRDSGAMWAAGDSGRVYRRASWGSDWQAIPTPGTAAIRALAVLDGWRLYAAGDGGAIWYSSDNGGEWYAQYSADTHDLFGLCFTDSTHGFAAGSGGTVLRTASGGTLTEVTPSGAGLPASYGLSQNYPNPFNPETRIVFRIPHTGEVSLKVFDLLGREVATLIDGPVSAGEYRATWNAAGAASGVYFYRLRSGAFVETKKMILLR